MSENTAKKLRLSKGFTQTQIAIAAGITPSKLGHIERGLKCNQPTAKKLAAALNEKPETVFPNFSQLRGW
jgi:transcriptional regulator with XRE-family HTH domain